MVSTSNQRILIVEDQEDSRRILADLLSSAGYGVLQAASGEEGIAVATDSKPDLILMDIKLPGIDGYEATRRIKAHPDLEDVPIIVITSYAFSGDEQKAVDAGCDAYMSKPVSPNAVLGKVREFLPD